MFGESNALSADIIPAIARAMTASVEEAGDEEAAATQCPLREKKLLDVGSLQVIEEDAAALVPSSLPQCEPADVMLCMLRSWGSVH